MDLVIGGCGFIGHHLVRELIERRRTVLVYDVAPWPEEYSVRPHDIIRGDILDTDKLTPAVAACSRVYHLAGNPLLWERDPEVFERVNHQGTRNVLRAVSSAKVERLVFTSTESILAQRDRSVVITEDVQPCIEDMIGPYCRSKFLAEQAVFAAARNGLPAVIVCPTMPVGPGDHNLTPPGRMIADFLRGKIPGYIESTLNYIDVRDAALGHVLAMERGEPGRRYILAGHNIRLHDLFSLLSAAGGRPAPRLRIPYHVALAWSYIEEGWCKLSGGMPQSSVVGVRLCRRSLAFDGSLTRQTLGYRPRPIEESVRDAVQWHLQRIRAEENGQRSNP